MRFSANRSPIRSMTLRVAARTARPEALGQRQVEADLELGDHLCRPRGCRRRTTSREGGYPADQRCFRFFFFLIFHV